MTPEDLAAANLAAMKKKEKRGKDRMGHDKNMQYVYVTPGSPEDIILTRNSASASASNAFIATGFAAACI